MNHNLTQPEEVDLISRTLVSHDQAFNATKEKPAGQGGALKKTARNTRADANAITGDFSDSAQKTKSAHGFSEAYPYVWSM